MRFDLLSGKRSQRVSWLRSLEAITGQRFVAFTAFLPSHAQGASCFGDEWLTAKRL